MQISDQLTSFIPLYCKVTAVVFGVASAITVTAFPFNFLPLSGTLI